MKILRFIIAFIISLSFFFQIPKEALAFEGVLKQANQTISTEGGIMSQAPISYPGRMSGQTFTANSTYWATGVSVYIKRVGTPTGTYRIGIKATSGGLPTGNYLSSTSMGLVSDLSLDYLWFGYTFGSYTQLTNGVVYAITIEPESGAGDGSNYIQWRSSIQEYIPFTGNVVYDDTPETPWVTNTGTSALSDGLFRIYGQSEAPADVSLYLSPATTTLRSNGLYSAAFFLRVYSTDGVTFSDNATARISESLDFSTPYAVNQKLYTDDTSQIYVFETGSYEWYLAGTDNGTLPASTTFYYQGIASVNGTDYYSAIKTFNTIPDSLPDKPGISIIKMENVSKDYYFDYGIKLTASIASTNTTDEVTLQGFQFSLASSPSGTLLPEIYSYQANRNIDDDTYYLVIGFDDFADYEGETLYFQAWIETEHYGRIYSKTLSFDWESTGGGSPDPLINLIEGYSTPMRYFSIVLAMGVCFYGFRRSVILRVLVPLLVFGLAMVMGWIPWWVIIVLTLGAGLTLYQIFRRKAEGGI